MKYKKIMLILIAAIFLASIAGVCAADANDTTVASENTNQMDLSSNNEITEDNLKTSEENTPLTQANDDETVSAETDLKINNHEFGYDSKIKDGEIPKNGDYELTVDAKVDYDSVDITVNLPIDVSAPVLIDVDGVGYYANATDGTANLHLDNLTKGGHYVVAKYIGDANYAGKTNTTSFVILNKTLRVQVIAQNVTSAENTSFIIGMIDEFDGNVLIKVEGKVIYNGSAKLLTLADRLTEGYKTATMVFYGDKRYDELILDNVKFSVGISKTHINAYEVTATYNSNRNFVFTLEDSEGNTLAGQTVTVNLNGVKTYITDRNGQIKVPTKGLAPKTYTAKITFNGNTNYAESSKDVKVTVKKATPKLTAKKKTFKSSVKTKKYTVTLKDNTGKAIKKANVILKVKGKTYKATTNSKGKATFKIKKLNKKGTYKAIVTYKGNKYYNKATKKAKIKVIVTFKTVSKGSKDKATVREIQQALKNNGYYLTYDGHYLKIDGIYHGCTERSVKEFQHDKGLKVTGKVDEKTAKKLGII